MEVVFLYFNLDLGLRRILTEGIFAKEPFMITSSQKGGRGVVKCPLSEMKWLR